MNSVQFFGAIEMGLIFGLIGIGVYLSFRVLDFPDLTVDGSFPLGAAVAAILIVEGLNPWLATFIAMLAGSLAGLITAWLNVRWKILHLLASILTMTALYSVNLRVMGRPNIAFLNQETVFTPFETLFSRTPGGIALAGLIIVSVIALLYRFLSSEIGLAMRATGKNPRMAIAHGVRTPLIVISGIALSNSIIALAGALYAQNQGFADINMGQGTIVIGLAAVLIGEAFWQTRSVFFSLVACSIGAIVHRFVMALALNSDFLGLQTSDVSLVTAAIVALALMFSYGRKPLFSMLAKKRSVS